MWRPDQLVTEARRNLGPAHLALGALTMVVLAGCLALVLLQGHRALDQEATRRAAGSLVWTAVPIGADPLDGAACTRLAGLPGVAAAGGQSMEPPTGLRAFAGGRSLPLVGLTAGAARVFSPSTPVGEVTVGDELAALGEVGVGSWLVGPDGQRAVQIGAFVRDAPVGALSASVAVPVLPDVPLAQCWVRMLPAAVALGHDVLTAAFPGGTATVTPFLREQAGDVTPLDQWQRTMAVQPWALAGAVIAGTSGLVLWSRRTELAVYRTFGTPRSALLTLVTLEHLLVLVPALAAGVLLGAVGFAAATRAGAPGALVSTALAQVGAAALLGLVGALLPALLVTRGSLTETLRDR